MSDAKENPSLLESAFEKEKREVTNRKTHLEASKDIVLMANMLVQGLEDKQIVNRMIEASRFGSDRNDLQNCRGLLKDAKAFSAWMVANNIKFVRSR